jgi:hypothetical protein
VTSPHEMAWSIHEHMDDLTKAYEMHKRKYLQHKEDAHLIQEKIKQYYADYDEEIGMTPDKQKEYETLYAQFQDEEEV